LGQPEIITNRKRSEKKNQNEELHGVKEEEILSKHGEIYKEMICGNKKRSSRKDWLLVHK
jgi:hypothetical protein